MSTYQVFVDRPRDASDGAHQRLATAMAARYGLPAADLEPRLRAGRFRVKANVDRDTAEKFALDLERLGAEVVIVDDAGETIARGAPPARPSASALDGAAPRAGANVPSSGLAAAAPRPVTATPPPSALPPRASAPARNQTATNPPSGQFTSGLSAAFGDIDSSADLGALGVGAESGSFALATLDGKGDREPASSSGSFAPADAGGLPASIGPAMARPDTGQTTPPPQASQGPIDMFAPPDAAAEMDFAVDIADKPARARAMSTPPVAAPSPAAAAARAAANAANALPDPSPAVSRGPSLGDRARAAAGNARIRMVAGAALAVILGFAPAAVIAKVREGTAFTEIDAHLQERQAQVRNVEDWNTLDRVREAHHDQKLAEKHSIALESLLIWAAFSAGFAFVWFRKIDWDRVATAR